MPFSKTFKSQKKKKKKKNVCHAGYIVEMTEFGSDSWRHVPGFCPRCNFTVKSLVEGRRYIFRVRAENMYGVSEPLEGKPVVAKSPFDPPDAPSTPEILGYTPNSCSLTWLPPSNTGGRPVTGNVGRPEKSRSTLLSFFAKIRPRFFLFRVLH